MSGSTEFKDEMHERIDGEIRQREKAYEGVMKMTASLQIAVQLAGGGCIPHEKLETMTVKELICQLGPNNIVFKYVGEQ